MNRSREDELPFATLGHYEIRRRIGHGGMGDVYLGYERPLDRLVAIKVLPAELARDAEFVRRFRAEATSVARLIHPNIVPIFYIGEDQGHHFYAMQFIEGESLAELLARRGALSVEEALPIVEQTLAGLALAHDQGMVHRDIKPGNILLDQKSGRALLADFGLVKSLSSSVTGKTATGVVMGTVDYISPEQGRGQAVDARSDLYSLGVLLFRMLSGQLPFTADSPTALIFQHVYEKPPALKSKVAGVSLDLEMIVDRLLAKSASDRYPDARSLLSDLQAVRAGRPLAKFDRPRSVEKASPGQSSPTRIISAPVLEEEVDSLPDVESIRPPGWRDRARSVFWRHAPEAVQKMQGTQQLIDGAISKKRRQEELLRRLAGEAESILGHLHVQEREQRAVAERLQHQSAEGDAPTVIHATQAEEIAALQEADLLRAHVVEQQDQLGQIHLKLAQCVARRQQLENQRDILNARLRVAELRTAPSSKPKGSFGASLRIIGVLLLVIVFPVALYLNHNASEEIRKAQEVPSASWATQQSESSGSSSTEVTDISTQAPFDLVSLPVVQIAKAGQRSRGGPIQGAEFDPEGKRFAIFDTNNSIIHNVETWAEAASSQTNIDAGPRERPISLTATPDFTRLIVGTSGNPPEGGRIEVRDLVTGLLTAATSPIGVGAQSLVVHPDGKRLAAIHRQTNGNGRAHLWTLPGLTESRPLLDEETSVSAIVFHPDGKHILCGTTSGQVYVVRLDDGRTVQSFKERVAMINCMDISRDGRVLATGDDRGSIRLWDAQNWQFLSRIPAHRHPILAIKVSPDGETFATADETGTLLWDATLGVVRSVLRTRGPVFLDFHPTRPLLLTAEQKTSAITVWNSQVSPEPRLDIDTARGMLFNSQESITTRLQALDALRAVAGAGNSVWVIDRSLGSIRQEFSGHSAPISDVSLSADRRTLISGDGNGEVRVWNVATREALGTWSLPQAEAGDVGAVAISPDGSQILAGGTRGLFTRNVSSNAALEPLPCDLKQITSINWGKHADVAVIAGVSTETGKPAIVVWDTAARAVRSTFKLPTVDPIRRVALALGDGAIAVSAGQNVRLLDRNDGHVRQEWKVPDDRSAEIAVSPSGRLLLLSDTNHVAIWDLVRGNEVVQLTNFEKVLIADAFDFTPDEKQVILRDRSSRITWHKVAAVYGPELNDSVPIIQSLISSLQQNSHWDRAAVSEAGRRSDWQLSRLSENLNLRFPVPRTISEEQQFVTDGGWWVNGGTLVQAPGASRSAIDCGEKYNLTLDLSYDPGMSNQIFLLLGWSGGRAYCLSKPAVSNGDDWLLTSLSEGTSQKVRAPRHERKVGPEKNLSVSIYNGGLTLVESTSRKAEEMIPMPGFQKGRIVLGAIRGPAGTAPLRIGQLKIQ